MKGRSAPDKATPAHRTGSSSDQDRVLAEARALLEEESKRIAEANERNPILPSLRTNSFGAAQTLLDRFFTQNGLKELVYWRECWYSYFNELWSERTDQDITHFLHSKLLLCRQLDSEGNAVDFNTSQRTVGEIQFQVQQLVSIPSNYSAPVALMDGEWEPRDATGKIVCRGQIVDMVTGEVTSNHHLFIPNGAEWRFDPSAGPATTWDNFLRDLFGDKDDEVRLLQEWFGYVLSGERWAHKGLIVVGPKRAGKGTIGHVLSLLLGESMVASPGLSTLGKDFGLQNLLDKRLCLVSDARLSKRADIVAVIEVMLRITAGDAIDVGRKHKSSIQTKLGARIMMLSNEMPSLGDSSDAISSRFLILLLQNSFYRREDRFLLDRLKCELPSIALWALEGYRRLVARGFFDEPESSRVARNDWYQENNPMSLFVEECCTLDTASRVATSALYLTYQQWASTHGVSPLASNVFSYRLATTLQGKVKRSKTGSTRFFRGLRLNSASPPM